AGAVASHAEQSAVARLDLLARPLDAGGVLRHGLDIAERLAAGLLLDQRMHRPQGPEIDDELLAFLREAIALEQSRRVRIGRVLEHAVRADHEWGTFRRIADLDRPAVYLALEHVVFAAPAHRRPLAGRERSPRGGRALHW